MTGDGFSSSVTVLIPLNSGHRLFRSRVQQSHRKAGLNPFEFRASAISLCRLCCNGCARLNPFEFRASAISVSKEQLISLCGLNPFEFRASAISLPPPPRHNSCRLHRTKNLGGGDEGNQWRDTDKHSRTGRLLGCCRRRALRQKSWRGKLGLKLELSIVGERMLAPCPPRGGHGAARRACRP